jgi:hypothetical protein
MYRHLDDTVFGRALDAERAAFRQVVRWRALYSKRRAHIDALARYSHRAADRLHYRLKDLEYAAIDRHDDVAHHLAALWDHLSRALPPLAECGLIYVAYRVDNGPVVAWPVLVVPAERSR